MLDVELILAASFFESTIHKQIKAGVLNLQSLFKFNYAVARFLQLLGIGSYIR